jgi:hypothetical protein
MFGVPIEGLRNVFCDNEAVCKNRTRPESTLTKKHHSIAYHQSREAVAAGTVRVSKEDTLTNLADIFTKTMAAPKRENLLDSFTYKIRRTGVCGFLPLGGFTTSGLTKFSRKEPNLDVQ